jgi:hypothetical protein
MDNHDRHDTKSKSGMHYRNLDSSLAGVSA